MTIPLGFAEIRWFFTGSGAPTGAATTLGAEVTLPTTPQAKVEEAHDAFGDEVMPFLVQNVGLSRTELKFGPEQTGITVETSGERSGGVLTPQAAPNLAYLVIKQTALGGRRGKGRLYLPGVAEAAVDQAGNVLSSQVSTLDDAFEALRLRLVAIGLEPHLLHDPPQGQNPSPQPPPTEIVSFSASAVAATQRRRMRR